MLGHWRSGDTDEETVLLPKQTSIELASTATSKRYGTTQEESFEVSEIMSTDDAYSTHHNDTDTSSLPGASGSTVTLGGVDESLTSPKDQQWENRSALEESQDGKTLFIKVHAPLGTLAILAEASSLRLPLRLQPSDQNDFCNAEERQGCKSLCSPFKSLREDHNHTLEANLTAPFVMSRSSMYKIENRYTMFTRAQRNLLIADAINGLLVTPADVEAAGEKPAFQYPVGLTWFLETKVLTAAYPMHEGCLTNADLAKSFNLYTSRQRLKYTWASFRRLLWRQPVDEIRNYFGEKIAFYFCWLEYYTNSLLVPSLFGTLALFAGITYQFFDTPTKQICEGGTVSNWTVCPSCSMPTCGFTKMVETCADIITEVTFTNYFSIAFTVFMSVWAALFQEGWKRRQSTLAARWETAHRRPGFEQVRPDYYRSATVERKNPVSGKLELYVPDTTVHRSAARSMIFVVTMVITVIGAVVGIIVFKLFFRSTLTIASKKHFLPDFVDPSLATTVVASTLNFLVILILSKVYEKLAWTLTFHEYPRTLADFERSYVIKMYCFQFINYYSSMFYLSFVDGNLAASPKDRSTFTGSAKLPGFTSQVTIQLATILVIQQIISNISEVLVPASTAWWRRRKHVATIDNPYDQWESDYDLLPSEPLGLAPEYFELILQYGLITMFVSAFPIAPALAFLNNMVEIRVDAIKWLEQKRRDVPVQADSIGIYYELMEFASTVAVLVNGAFIAFTTDFVPRMVVLGKEGAILVTSTPPCSLHQYWNLTMSTHYEKTQTGVVECVYMGMLSSPQSEEPYSPTTLWWEVWLSKVAFMLVYENAVFLIKSLVDKMIPDVPEEVILKQEREAYLTRQAFYDTQFADSQ